MNEFILKIVSTTGWPFLHLRKTVIIYQLLWRGCWPWSNRNGSKNNNNHRLKRRSEFLRLSADRQRHLAVTLPTRRRPIRRRRRNAAVRLYPASDENIASHLIIIIILKTNKRKMYQSNYFPVCAIRKNRFKKCVVFVLLACPVCVLSLGCRTE